MAIVGWVAEVGKCSELALESSSLVDMCRSGVSS